MTTNYDYDERPAFMYLSESKQRVARAAWRVGWEPGSTIWNECTCLQVSGPTWDCDAEYEDDPMCWEHGEDLDREEWIIEQGADWCREHGYDPITGEDLG